MWSRRDEKNSAKDALTFALALVPAAVALLAAAPASAHFRWCDSVSGNEIRCKSSTSYVTDRHWAIAHSFAGQVMAQGSGEPAR